MSRISKKIRSAVLVVATMAVAAISVSASDFAGRTMSDAGVIAPAALPASSSGLVATTVQFRRPLGYYDRWGVFHYYSWVYRGRDWDDFRFRRGDWDDYHRYHRDWDDHHRRDWDRDRYRHYDRR